MKIIPGEWTDIWYDRSDLTDESLIIIRRESITCCGFLGGDTLQIAGAGSSFASLLLQYRPQLPYSDRTESFPGGKEADLRRDGIIASLRSIDRKEGGAGRSEEWKRILAAINETIWFGGEQDLFRFSLILLGSPSGLCDDEVYGKRLVACLRWWYLHEASDDERDQYQDICRLTRLRYPSDRSLIVRGVNLYNHGAYELSRDEEPVWSSHSSSQ